MQPKISIIVAVKNCANSIEKTIENILSQQYDNIELIVIDGVSNDGTVDIINKYKSKIAYFISEPDSGIPDAYNKGIRVASGDWIYFLNADDVFYSDTTLNDLFEGSRDYAKYDLVVGRVYATDGRVFSGTFSPLLLMRNTIHHQGIFYSNSLLKNIPYSTAYKRYAHDYEHCLILWRRNVKVYYSDLIIAIWATGGISDRATWNDYKQEFLARRVALGAVSFPFNIFTIIRFILKGIKIKLNMFIEHFNRQL